MATSCVDGPTTLTPRHKRVLGEYKVGLEVVGWWKSMLMRKDILRKKTPLVHIRLPHRHQIPG